MHVWCSFTLLSLFSVILEASNPMYIHLLCYFLICILIYILFAFYAQGAVLLCSPLCWISFVLLSCCLVVLGSTPVAIIFFLPAPTTIISSLLHHLPDLLLALDIIYFGHYCFGCYLLWKPCYNKGKYIDNCFICYLFYVESCV